MHFNVCKNLLCRYEGLTRESVPHGKGVLVLGNGTGGGIQDPLRGDRCAIGLEL